MLCKNVWYTRTLEHFSLLTGEQRARIFAHFARLRILQRLGLKYYVAKVTLQKLFWQAELAITVNPSPGSPLPYREGQGSRGTDNESVSWTSVYHVLAKKFPSLLSEKIFFGRMSILPIAFFGPFGRGKCRRRGEGILLRPVLLPCHGGSDLLLLTPGRIFTEHTPYWTTYIYVLTSY
jgi:hypothetical protein